MNRNNLTSHKQYIAKSQRNQQNGHRSFVIWMTGLSGAGKSTLANELATYFFQKNVKAYILDGDNIRLGLNSDLSFSDKDRSENIRRVAEVAKLMIDAGLMVITAFISPFSADRLMAKNIIGAENFVEVFVDASLENCEKRDVKGLYQKARKGEVKSFTGIDSPFEKPENPTITIHTDQMNIAECVAAILAKLDYEI